MHPDVTITALRLARQSRGMRLLDLALAAGMSEVALSRAENGDAAITRRQLARAAEVLGFDEATLRGERPITVRGRPVRVR